MNENIQLRKQIATDIAMSLGLERPPAMFEEQQLEQANIRSRSSLQSDRAKGEGIPYVKIKGLVRYPLSAVLNFVIGAQKNHTGDDLSEFQQAALARNLKKAQAKRRVMGTTAWGDR